MHETTTHRFETCLESEAGGGPDHRHQGIEGRPGSIIAGFGRHNLGTDCQLAGSGTGLGAPLAAAVWPKRCASLRTRCVTSFTNSEKRTSSFVRARDQAGNSDANKVEREGQNLCD